ncbi:ribosomal RNA large subunit methyltransferase H [Bacteroidia bacterium]|nr:ribosomal RNA large subunit methyltransferase H [Bacteroidia bacterium]
MKIQLIVIGKTSQDFVERGLAEYAGRLKHYLPFEMQIIPDIKNAKNLSFEQIKEKEGECLLKILQPGDYVALLDEHGKEFTSMQFAAYLEKKKQTIAKNLVFVIGGPYGFSQKIYDLAQEKISLSKMTFSHQLIRLIFAEQLYRAMTILGGEPYHHE